MAVRGVPRPRAVPNDASSDDADDNDGENLLEKIDLEGMSEKQRKLWEKKTTQWRVFVDFLFRHVSIVTFKFNCFERDELLSFMLALDRAEGLRSQMKLKKNEQARITSLRSMNTCSELLVTHNLILESNRIRKFLDIAARIRGLVGIALSFFKSMKKGKAPGSEKLKEHIDIWKGMCVRSFDYTTLSIRRRKLTDFSVGSAAAPPAPGSLEARFVGWPAALRSALWEAQCFLQRSCRATGLSLISTDPLNSLQRHMQAAEYVLASHLHTLLTSESGGGSNPGAAVRQQQAAAIALLHGGPVLKSNDNQWDLPNVDDVDPELLQPISEHSLLLEIPAELPKEKKMRKRTGGKSGKKSGKKKSSGKKGKKKK